MGRSKTPSFITEIPLATGASEELTLLKRLEAGRQLYNACLGEAVRRVKLIQQSKLFQFARTLPKTVEGEPNPERKKAFALAWEAYDFSDYSLQGYAGKIRKSWIEQHIDADTAQKLGTRAFQAAKRVLLGQAKRVRFKGQNQLDSLEGKSKRSPMKWRNEAFAWKGLTLRPLIERNDPIILHGLSSPVKYVRLVRRKLNGKHRFYVQLLNEGRPFQKPKNTAGSEIVGLDIGPSTLAVVGDSQAFLRPFCAEIKDAASQIARLQRQMARQQRANNPDCHEPSCCDLPKRGQKHGKRKLGKSIKGKRHKHFSKRYGAIKQRKANIERRLEAHRKSLQGELVNQVLTIGSVINLEKLSYRSFQKLFGRSVGKRAPGMFVSRLKQKAENAGGIINEFPTKETKLSQRCICGQVKKKPLSQRVHACDCGVRAQRDLFSAYLAKHVDLAGCFQAEPALSGFQGLDTILKSAWAQADSRYSQSSIGSPRVVNVVPAAASERIDSKTLDDLPKSLDGVETGETWGREPGRGQLAQRTPCL